MKIDRVVAGTDRLDRDVNRLDNKHERIDFSLLLT